MKLSEIFNFLKMVDSPKSATIYFLSSLVTLLFSAFLYFHYPDFTNTTSFILIVLFFLSFAISLFTIIIHIYEKCKLRLVQRKEKKQRILQTRVKYKNYYPKEVWDVITQLINNGNVDIKISKSTFEVFEEHNLVFPKEYQTYNKNEMNFAFSKGVESTPLKENELTEKEKYYIKLIGYSPIIGARYVSMNHTAYQEIKEACFKKTHGIWVLIL